MSPFDEKVVPLHAVVPIAGVQGTLATGTTACSGTTFSWNGLIVAPLGSSGAGASATAGRAG